MGVLLQTLLDISHLINMECDHCDAFCRADTTSTYPCLFFTNTHRHLVNHMSVSYLLAHCWLVYMGLSEQNNKKKLVYLIIHSHRYCIRHLHTSYLNLNFTCTHRASLYLNAAVVLTKLRGAKFNNGCKATGEVLFFHVIFVIQDID